jgi:hypothetical protein
MVIASQNKVHWIERISASSKGQVYIQQQECEIFSVGLDIFSLCFGSVFVFVYFYVFSGQSELQG